MGKKLKGHKWKLLLGVFAGILIFISIGDAVNLLDATVAKRIRAIGFILLAISVYLRLKPTKI